MKKLVVLLLSVLMLVSLAACGGKTDTETTPTDTGSTTGPKTFTFAVGDSPSYMDPAVASDSIGSYVINQMFFPLFYLGPDGLTNGACEDYTVSEDGLVYTLT